MNTEHQGIFQLLACPSSALLVSSDPRTALVVPPKQSPARTASDQMKTRPLKSTCDACAESKVKCDRNHPECIRCTLHGVRCHYSESKRLGKPPASARRSKSLSTSSIVATSFQEGAFH